MSTQWRIGMNGATGLDYVALEAVARFLRIKITPELFDGIRIMEDEALRIFREKQGNN